LRIQLARFIHRSDSFASRPTRIEDFARGPGLSLTAPAGGPLRDDCFHALLEELKEEVARESPDGMLMVLSGSTLTESDEDADGTILAEVRSCLSRGVPLVAVVEPYANLSPLMVSRCDALLTDRGEAKALLLRMVREDFRPSMALAKPPLMANPDSEAMRELGESAQAAEAEPGVIRVVVCSGCAGADVPRMGMGILILTEGDADLAAHLAENLAEEAWALRAWLAEGLFDAPPAYRNIRCPLYPIDRW
jgi:microcystin degradation protein MlrC